MSKLIISFFLFFWVSVAGQQTKDWLNQLENPKYESDKLKAENLKSKYLHYDFSTLMIPRHEFLGYIGENYKRVKIFFTSVSKNATDEAAYNIKGLSLVGNNICNFNGTVRIQQIREFNYIHYGVDSIYKDAGFKSQGLLIGDYELKEDSSQNHCGVFTGLITLYWCVDRNGILHFDDIEWYSDNYRNNQYVGTWNEYGINNSKVCNWGELRIPFSGDLDIGAAGFSPNSKYADNGWKDYISDK